MALAAQVRDGKRTTRQKCQKAHPITRPGSKTTTVPTLALRSLHLVVVYYITSL